MKRLELTGKQFGKLTIRRYVGTTAGKKNAIWEADCQCGTTINAQANNLRSGNTTSCGLCDREKRHYVHGGRRTTEYSAYHTAYQRCNNPKNARYYRYGARGIEFRFTNFKDFIECVGVRPEGYVLDRIDNDGHYEIGNLQWATKSQSIRNSSKCLGGAIYKRRVKA